MVLTDTGLEDLVKPVCIDLVRVKIERIVKLIACRSLHTAVCKRHTYIVTVLCCIHYVIYAALDLVNTHIATVVDLHRLFLLTALCCDDHHTVGSTRTIDRSCRSVLEDLDCLDVVWREVTDCSTHRHTVDHIERSCASEAAQTTDTY